MKPKKRDVNPSDTENIKIALKDMVITFRREPIS
jgi:hypothetical protein